MITLEEFKKEDANDLIKWVKSEEELIQFAGTYFEYPLTADQIVAFQKEEKRSFFKVIYTPNKMNIGVAELYNYSESTNKIARVLIGERSMRGRGIGTELIEMLVKYSFDKDGKNAVILNVYDWNTPAIKCYNKVGFKKTGENSVIVNVGEKKWKSIEMRITNKR